MGLGYIEEIPKGHKGYGKYKYRVIGRIGVPCHHTNSLKDAEEWLNKCRKHWAEEPQIPGYADDGTDLRDFGDS